MVTDASGYQRTVLPNGLRIVSERISNVRSVALGVWVETGSRDESPEINGVSHFLEHMVFKGTARRSAREIAESIESVGGSLNAFTTKELCCFSAHVLDEDLELAIDVLSDLLLHALLDEEDIEREKQVILSEIRQFEETPEEVVFERFYQAAFDGHPLAQEIHGTPQNVERMNRETLLTYFRQHYTANRLVIAAAGNLEHERLVDLVEAHFQDVPDGGARHLAAVPPFRPNELRFVDRNCQQVHVCVGGRGLPYASAQKFPLLVLDTLLGGGMSSRLFQEVREARGLAYSIYSFADFLFDTGTFGVYAATDLSAVEETLGLIHRQLDAVRDGGISEQEVERTKRQLKGSLLLGLENTGSRMSRLARMEIYLGEYVSLDEVAAAIDAVRTEQVAEVASWLLDRSNRLTVLLLPEAG
ncbi:MAG: insulinase family protein [candidate division KSB1 bacterium]|nr:insulinase family protein [candidate division KSB1 bacterium]